MAAVVKTPTIVPASTLVIYSLTYAMMDYSELSLCYCC